MQTELEDPNQLARSAVLLEYQAAARGDRVYGAIAFDHAPKWHTYWLNPGDSGLATRLDWDLPAGVSAGPILWPAPERHALSEIYNFGYSDRVLLPFVLTIADDYADATIRGSVTVKFLVCEELCIPGQMTHPIELTLAERARSSASAGEIRTALAALPKQVDRVDGEAKVVGKALQVRFKDPGLEAVDFEVFPEQIELLNHAPVTLRKVGSEFQFTHPLSDYYSAMPATVRLLLVDRADRARSFMVELVTASGATASAVSAETGAAAAGDLSGPIEMPPAVQSLSIWMALLLAFGGGVILNLMPCVFPVLSLKVMGLAEAGSDLATARAHGYWYLIGVLVSFACLAGLLLVLRAGGQALGWGFQLQSPLFVALLTLLMYALGLWMSGLYFLGGALANVGSSLASSHGPRGAFFTGVLAVLVATPCTAPFMASALGYALNAPAWAAFLVFMALGLGLAAPLVMISTVPALARLLPAPGLWMEQLKQLMAYPLYLTAAWLLWVLMRQSGADAAALVLIAAVFLALAIWLARESALMAGGWLRSSVRALALMAAVAVVVAVAAVPAVGTAHAQTASVVGEISEPYSAARLSELRAAGTPVLVNMTADWCLTCKANERVALSSDEFKTALADAGVQYLKGDWTHTDPAITAYLANYQRGGVPLYVLYPGGGGEPRIWPQLLRPSFVLDELRALKEVP